MVAIESPLQNSPSDPNQAACHLCQSTGPHRPLPQFSTPEWHIVQCATCNHAFLANPPPYQALEDEFAWEKSFQAEIARRKQDEPVVYALSSAYKSTRARTQRISRLGKMIQAHLPAGQIIDIGCGSGSNLGKIIDTLQLNSKLIPLGIEVSPQLAADAHIWYHRLGGKVISANSQAGLESFEPNSLDGAFLASYLEHEIQPILILESLHRILKPGAPIFVKVPNYASVNRHIRGKKWCGFRLPEHVNYFTPQSLIAVAKKSGFSLKRMNFGDQIPTSDSLYAIFQKPTLS